MNLAGMCVCTLLETKSLQPCCVPQIPIFRSNYCLGGTAALYTLTDKERKLAVQAVRGLEIGMAGIDFIFHNGEMVFNEIEDMAGARALYALSYYDIADDYIRYIREKICC